MMSFDKRQRHSPFTSVGYGSKHVNVLERLRWLFDIFHVLIEIVLYVVVLENTLSTVLRESVCQQKFSVQLMPIFLCEVSHLVQPPFFDHFLIMVVLVFDVISIFMCGDFFIVNNWLQQETFVPPSPNLTFPNLLVM